MNVPVVILCGGQGIYCDDSGHRRSKALVQVEGKPLVQHLIEHYVRAGFRRLVLSAGLQAEELERQVATVSIPDAEIRVVRTGAETSTAQRIAGVSQSLAGAEDFAVTYSDTLANIDLSQLWRFHHKHQKLATLVSTRMPTRFRILGLRYGENQVRGFVDKSLIKNDLINGGFYFFKREILGTEYLGNPKNAVLETQVLEKLVERHELLAYPFQGSWQHLDSERDMTRLAEIAREMATGAVHP